MPNGVTIVRGTNDKPAASDSLVELFQAAKDLDGQLMIGYPIIGTATGRHPIDAVYISPTRGVVVFDLVDGRQLGDYRDRQDDAATKLESRLITYKELMFRRKLRIPVTSATYAPGIRQTRVEDDEGYAIVTDENLHLFLEDITWNQATEELYLQALSAIQSISTIRQSRTSRSVDNPSSRGAKLQRLEASIATLDLKQSKAVIETVEGVQRIRGLAGSGKTIVLALKAAYLHAQHPSWRMAVTFNSRSLKDYFRRLISTFALEQTGEEPDWERIRVINSWGAPGLGERQGLYSEFCSANKVEYLNFSSASLRYGRDRAFAGACAEALTAAPNPKSIYDAILIDEAQDLPPDFLRVCYEMLDEHKRLVYAYDELQNLTGTSVPDATEIFGKHKDGRPKVTFDPAEQRYGARSDIILEKCYRNSRPVLVTAHALGFGIYRRPPREGRTGLVQFFQYPGLWKDIGYRVRNGELAPNHYVRLYRPEETSPRFLESHSPIEDLVEFVAFDTEAEQSEWVVENIVQNLTRDELRHDDIIVINPDPITTRRRLGPVRRRLLERGVRNHLAGVDTDADTFYKRDADSITFTGIYRAKGNEAGMVYVVNAHDCTGAGRGNMARLRNQLFTAITRSKAWVRVLGVGPAMRELMEEFAALQSAAYELRFRYPTDAEQEELQILHRDVTAEEQRVIESRRRGLGELIEDLESGRLYREDLDDELLERLSRLLNRES